MKNKTINQLTNYILPAIIIITTIILFIVFKPKEPTALFYTNMIYSVWLEVIFFGYLNVLQSKTKTVSTSFFITLGTQSIYYILAGLGVMLIYTFLLSLIISVWVYIAFLVIITLLWLFTNSLIAQTDSNYKESVDLLNNQQQSLEYYKQKIILLASRYHKLCMEKNIAYKTDSNNRTILDKLQHKISFLTPNILSGGLASAQIKDMLEKCESIIDEIESANDEDIKAAEKKMQRFVDNSVAELDMLKNLTRK